MCHPITPTPSLPPVTSRSTKPLMHVSVDGLAGWAQNQLAKYRYGAVERAVNPAGDSSSDSLALATSAMTLGDGVGAASGDSPDGIGVGGSGGEHVAGATPAASRSAGNPSPSPRRRSLVESVHMKVRCQDQKSQQLK